MMSATITLFPTMILESFDSYDYMTNEVRVIHFELARGIKFTPVYLLTSCQSLNEFKHEKLVGVFQNSVVYWQAFPLLIN